MSNYEKLIEYTMNCIWEACEKNGTTVEEELELLAEAVKEKRRPPSAIDERREVNPQY